MGNTLGYIHSVESFGAVDGPGIRFVVFFQGCPLRCLFCHNADTWNPTEGTATTADELFAQIKQYKNFIRNGGVTLSGGEPLMQPEFALDLINLCKAEGLHTAVDTSGGISLAMAKPVLEAADMLLLDIKDIDKDDCKILTGQSNKNAMDILNYCEYLNREVWIRHVILPGYTMNEAKLDRLAKVLSWYKCIKKIELTPFHKMGEYKWDYIETPYALHDINPPTEKEMQIAKEIMKKYGLPL